MAAETFDAMCVDASNTSIEVTLTLGKTYSVRQFGTYMTEVTDDRGRQALFSMGRFARIVAPPQETPSDAVDHPAHYGSGPYEAILVIEAWGLGFNLGNSAKYISRAGKKTSDALEDLKKAAWYLNREIKNLEAK